MTPATTEVRPSSRASIEQRARTILEEYHQAAIPIDPIAIAVRLGIRVHLAKFDDDSIAGMIVRDQGRTEILTRDRDSVHRQCFTIAHELGHYVLHFLEGNDEECIDPDVNMYRQNLAQLGSDEASDQRSREVEANLFAAALLMPEADVRRAWGNQKTVTAMARLFDVSELAMRYRIDQLGLW